MAARRSPIVSPSSSIRPAELEDPELARDLQREALFGDNAVLDSSEGTRIEIEGSSLILDQGQGSLSVDEGAAVRIVQPATSEPNQWAAGIQALIHEDVTGLIQRAVRFTGWVLDRQDPTGRVTDVVVAARLVGSGHMPWRTRDEHQASPNAGNLSMGEVDRTVMLTPPRRHRQALTHDADGIATDLATLLRRSRRR